MTNLDFSANFIPFLAKVELAGIPHTVTVSGNGMKIEFEDGSDIALNEATYGHDKGLLEGYKGKFRTFDDDVMGYLTAKQAFDILTLVD